jgi:hypothetical protein
MWIRTTIHRFRVRFANHAHQSMNMHTHEAHSGDDIERICTRWHGLESAVAVSWLSAQDLAPLPIPQLPL